MVPDDIGIDDGAIWESLRDPIWTRTKVTTKYRHNKDGLVTSEEVTTDMKQLTGAQVLAMVIGPPLVALLLGVAASMDDEERKSMLAGTALLGPFLGPIVGYGASQVGDLDVTDKEGWVKRWFDLLGIDAEF